MVRRGEGGPKGISALVVEKATRGLSFGAQEHEMGWNAQPTALINFDDCRVLVENQVAAEARPSESPCLDGGQLNIGARRQRPSTQTPGQDLS